MTEQARRRWEYLLEVYAKGQDELTDTIVLKGIGAGTLKQLLGLDLRDDEGAVYPLNENQVLEMRPFVSAVVNTSEFDYYLTSRAPARCRLK